MSPAYQIEVIFQHRQPLHKEAVCGCSFLYIIAKKTVIMSEAFLVDVSILACWVIFHASFVVF